MKRKYGILCLFLLLCLTACGETPEAVADPLQVEAATGMVYVPEFSKVEFDAGYLQAACLSGGNVYLVGDAIQESEIEGPGGETIPIFLGGTALFQGEPGGAAFRRVEGYRSFDLLDGADGYIMTPGCWPGEEGTVWLWTAVSPWDGQPSRDYVQRFDAAGKEVARFELGALGLAAGDVRCVITDREGRLYASTLDSVFAYDGDGRLLCSLDAPKNAGWDALVRLANGQAALRTAAPAADGAQELRSIHPEAGDWGASYPLPVGGGRVYGGGGDWLYFCTGGDSLYGYDIEAGRLERLLSWTGVSIDSGQVLCAAPLEDGRLLTVTNPGSGAETIVLTPTDPASLPEVTVLTYATLSLDSGTRSKIVEFNKAHPDCRIEVRDYSEYGTGPDPSAGRTRLQTELLAGNIPDLLDNSGLPMGQYARRGYLEDLLPWLEGDPDLGREAVMTQVIDAACRDGKLYQAFPSFTILTAAGRPELVGGRLRWTLADLAEAMKAMPEGGTALGAGREETLELLLPMLLDSFVDRDAGAASFDGEAFRTLLEFCAACPAPEDGESPYTRTQEGRQLLLPAELGTLEWEFILYPTAFGGKCSFVGYPREDGGAGSCFRLGDGVSMTAACRNKEAAWTFVRETFLPRYPTGTYFGSAYPINRADFDRMMAQAAAPELDENGQPSGASSSFLILPDDSLTIPGRKPTREELEQFTALYDAVDQVYDPDEKLLSIVREGAGAYFAGDKSLEDTVRLIQNRASLYLSENQ